MANETVAEDFFKKHVPFLYRVHETPDAERIKTFFEFCSAFGLNIHRIQITLSQLIYKK